MASWFGAIIMTIIFGFIFALLMPIDTNFDDPALEPTFTMLGLIAIMVIVLPSSIAVLKIKNRSMWGYYCPGGIHHCGYPIASSSVKQTIFMQYWYSMPYF